MSKKDKNVVHVFGGLGNQMFQYAFFIHLSNQGLNASINTGYFNNRSERLKHGSEFLLPSVFKRIKNNTDDDWMSKTMYSNTLLWTVIRRLRKIYFRKQNVLDTFPLIKSQHFDKAFSNLGVKHYRDYWQSVEYISNNENKIRSTFEFNTHKLGTENQAFIKQIERSNSVSIHVRRGDYLLHNDIYGSVCTEDYYANALNLINEKVANPHFYVFSDDVTWCRKFFTKLENVTYVDLNSKSSHFDMYLMSKCKHNIIANSSFSWWGAWLNNNPNKMVILPQQWTNTRTSKSIQYSQCIPIS